MSGEIPNVNTANLSRQASTVDAAEQFAKALGLSDKSVEIIKTTASLLGNRNVNVTPPVVRGEVGTVEGANGVPVLDDPDDELAKEVDLEKLIAYLQLENEKEQAESAKNRIDTMKGELDVEHKDRKAKLEKTLKDMDEAAKARLRNKIFGWVLTGLAILGAIVACVATGGLAVGAVIGAGIALTAQILNETGAMDKIVEGISKGLQSIGMSKEAADIVAQIAITLIVVAASCGAGAAGGAVIGASKAASAIMLALKNAAEIIRPALSIATGIVGGISTISSGVGSYQSYKAGMSQAELTETEKFLAIIQQRLDEAQEELEAILQAIQDLVSQIAQLLSSQTDTANEIAMQMGQMA